MSPSLSRRFCNVRAAVFDVDGVMTDGKLYFRDNGEELKAFHVRDGMGIKLLMLNDIEVAVMTARECRSVRHRMDNLGIKHYYSGLTNKTAAMEELQQSLRLQSTHLAYTGDDIVDLGAMRKAGVSCAVNDAHEAVKERADVVLSSAGGEGAVREVCELILKCQGKWEQTMNFFDFSDPSARKNSCRIRTPK